MELIETADDTPVDGELFEDERATNESVTIEVVADDQCASDSESTSDSEDDSDDEHRSFILTMDDGFECVARLALPCFPRYKTESEVATMQFVAERTSIRVPEVYAWDANPRNPIGAEYILMERIPGEPLNTIWKGLSLEKKKGIILQLIDVLLQLLDIEDTTLDKIGSLYKENEGYNYHVGLIMNTREYLTAVVQSQADYLKAPHASELDDREVQNGLSASSELEAISPDFFTTLKRLCLHHLDINTGNVMLQQADDTGDWNISGIIDWEAAGVYPAWSCVWCTKFIGGEGRDVETSDADNWLDADQFQQLLVETELRKFFHSETSKRSRAFRIAMDEGAKTRALDNQAIFARDYLGHVKRWISSLGSSCDVWE
ncbi:kinase-like domain-containing protein [Dissophora ornata]|nr:kinase-like domain-containing protein [Dissophora ornata]